MNIKFKEYQARKIALTDSEKRVYVYGWDDALNMASEILKDLGKSDLALLVKAIGSAQVNENTGKVDNDK